MTYTRFVFALIALIVISFAIPAEAKEVVTIGTMSRTQQGADLFFKEWIAHLNADKRFEFRLVAFQKHDDLYAALQKKKVAFAFVGPVLYAQARHELGVIPLLSDGRTIRSVIVVPKASAIKSVGQLKGKRFGFGYEQSTTTHLLPRLLLSKGRVQPEDLASSTFAGSRQQMIIENLLAGKFDAAGVADGTVKRYADQLRVLDSSKPFPGSALVVQKHVPAPLRNYVLQRTRSYKSPNGRGAFSRGSQTISDTDFNEIRFLCKVVLKKDYL